MDVDQQGAYSQPQERSRNDTSVHHSTHKQINAELVDLVDGEAPSMHNIEYTSDRMDLDTGDVPDPLNLQPMSTWTSDGPYLYLDGPSPDGGIDETVTMYFSPPRHTSRPLSRLDRLIRTENGSENEESEES